MTNIPDSLAGGIPATSGRSPFEVAARYIADGMGWTILTDSAEIRAEIEKRAKDKGITDLQAIEAQIVAIDNYLYCAAKLAMQISQGRF